MKKEEKEKLLSNPEVVQEIKNHLWLESEKAGYDIGFERAADDWIAKYSSTWLASHGTQQKKFSPKKKA